MMAEEGSPPFNLLTGYRRKVCKSLSINTNVCPDYLRRSPGAYRTKPISLDRGRETEGWYPFIFLDGVVLKMLYPAQAQGCPAQREKGGSGGRPEARVLCLVALEMDERKDCCPSGEQSRRPARPALDKTLDTMGMYSTSG